MPPRLVGIPPGDLEEKENVIVVSFCFLVWQHSPPVRTKMYRFTVIMINIVTAVINFHFDKLTDILGVIPRHGASVGSVKASV